MVLLVSRKIEEDHLRVCDGTCANGRSCACVTDLSMASPGSALSLFRLSKCVLCYRKEVSDKYDGEHTPDRGKFNPYVNIDYEYEESVLLGCENRVDRMYYGVTGPFVRYSAGDYRVVDGGIVQLLEVPPDVSDWLSSIFTLKLGESKKPSWNVCHCSNVRCKSSTLSFKDRFRAIGISGTYLSLSDESVRCDKCDEPVSYSQCDPDSGLVCFGGYKQYLTRCVFCSTLVDFRSWKSIQACRHCHKSNQESFSISNVKCAKCNCLINNTRRKNVQEVKVRKSDSAAVRAVYFCKQHRLPVYGDHVWTEGEIRELSNSR